MHEVRRAMNRTKAERKAAVIENIHTLIDLDPIEKEFKGKPYRTRALLEKAAEQVEIARLGSLKIQLIDDIRGEHMHLAWGPESNSYYDSNPRPIGVKLSWERLVGIVEKLQGHDAASPYIISPVYLSVSTPNRVGICNKHTIKPGNDDPLRQKAQKEAAPEQIARCIALREEWETNPQWAVFKTKLDVLASKVRVKNIVCIALGGSFTQRFVASYMAYYLREVYTSQSGAAEPVPEIDICAHDPIYQYEDVVNLEHFSPVPIHVVSDPYHYLAINESTLVFSSGCPIFVPYHEIIADVLYPGGPAAFLTNEFWDDFEWFEQSRVHILDIWTPRVAKMMKLYGTDLLEESLEWRYGYLFPFLSHLALYTREDAEDRYAEVDLRVDSGTESS
ncbi:hypothetical protein CC80DRAFT_553252 [Byssothecium circinans]|uniref:SRR1-like domain-containing protein n=1 Tax=Byssothecium circinans TaxID=147558 RepID=A0A6A5TFK9_9PLEO|nr:hypothetical protein CC80DRAFT_553252 [Byssothecium circinans]